MQKFSNQNVTVSPNMLGAQVFGYELSWVESGLGSHVQLQHFLCFVCLGGSTNFSSVQANITR